MLYVEAFGSLISHFIVFLKSLRQTFLAIMGKLKAIAAVVAPIMVMGCYRVVRSLFAAIIFEIVVMKHHSATIANNKFVYFFYNFCFFTFCY